MNGEAPKPQKAKDTPLESRDADHWTDFFRNRKPWYELPTFLGLVRVFGIRDRLRKKEPPRHFQRGVRRAAARRG